MSAAGHTEEPIKIPVMFGSGRTFMVGYDGIKQTHAPTLAITEVGPIKEHLLDCAASLRARGQGVDERKLHRAVELIDTIVLEAAEALADYGNYWPGLAEPKRALRDRLRVYRVPAYEERVIAEGLQWHIEECEREGQHERAARLGAARQTILEVGRRSRQARRRSKDRDEAQ